MLTSSFGFNANSFLEETGEGGFERIQIIDPRNKSTVTFKAFTLEYDIYWIQFANIQGSVDHNLLLRGTTSAEDFTNNAVHDQVVRSFRDNGADLSVAGSANNDFTINQTSGPQQIGADKPLSGELYVFHPGDTGRDCNIMIKLLYIADAVSGSGVHDRGIARFNDAPLAQLRLSVSAGIWKDVTGQTITLSGLAKTGGLN